MEINVLWIEDSNAWFKSTQNLLATRLKKRGFKLNVFRTRFGANIQSLLGKPIDFALCDFNLKEGAPDLSLEIIETIRAKNHYCQIIFYSGDAYIPAEIFSRLVRTAKCRYVQRGEVVDVAIEELESGLTIYAVIDKWLTYYGKDKGEFTFSLLGPEFKNKTVNQLTRSIRKGDEIGRKFCFQLSKHMLSLLVD